MGINSYTKTKTACGNYYRRVSNKPISISHLTDIGWHDNIDYLFFKHTRTQYIEEGGWDKWIHSHAYTKTAWGS